MELQRSENIGKLAEALAKAQGAYGALKRNRTVDYVTKTGAKIKYSYAELSEVLDICRKPLSDNGLAILQPSRIENGQAIVLTLLMHSSGEWISSELAITCAGHSPQEEGSALTYARRYGISATLGLASEPDDDAQAAQEAVGRGKPPVQAVAQPQPEPRPKPVTTAPAPARYPVSEAPVASTKPVAASAPAQPMQQAPPVTPTSETKLFEQTFPAQERTPIATPLTLPALLKTAFDVYGLQPAQVAKEGAVETPVQIRDIARVWAQIDSGKYPRKGTTK